MALISGERGGAEIGVSSGDGVHRVPQQLAVRVRAQRVAVVARVQRDGETEQRTAIAEGIVDERREQDVDVEAHGVEQRVQEASHPGDAPAGR